MPARAARKKGKRLMPNSSNRNVRGGGPSYLDFPPKGADESQEAYVKRLQAMFPPEYWGLTEGLSDSNLFEQMLDFARDHPQEALKFALTPSPGFRKKPPEPLPDDPGELLAEWFDKFQLFQALFIPGIDDKEVETPNGLLSGKQAWLSKREIAWRRMRRLTQKIAGLLANPAEAASLLDLIDYSWNSVPSKKWDKALTYYRVLEVRLSQGSLDSEKQNKNEEKTFSIANLPPPAPNPDAYILKTRVAKTFGLSNRQVERFLERHKEVGTKRPLSKSGKMHSRRLLIDIIAFTKAIQNDDLIANSKATGKRIEQNLQRLNLIKETENAVMQYISGN